MNGLPLGIRANYFIFGISGAGVDVFGEVGLGLEISRLLGKGASFQMRFQALFRH